MSELKQTKRVYMKKIHINTQLYKNHTVLSSNGVIHRQN